MSFTASDKLLSINEIHKKYLFRKKLGQGGFCDVFLAEDRNTGENVAIKMIKIDSSGKKIDKRAARFRCEMIINSQLDHANIVKILDSGETDTGLLFITFEYIKGYNLAQLLKKECVLSIPRTVSLMEQLLCGLDEAHTKGIIHRDLKPENIMVSIVDGAEHVKILDFGISTYISDQYSDAKRITVTKDFLGTPLYAAPEQLRGEIVSSKADIYAWGLLFIECITGKSPFSGLTVAAAVQQQLTSDPVPLPVVLVNHRLGVLLRWVLEKDVSRRAGNIPAILSHLKCITAAEEIINKNGYIIVDESCCKSGIIQNIMINETASIQQERRQVTAVCIMLNIQMINNYDSSDMLDEIYQDIMKSAGTAVAKYGAHVVNDSGDRILAFFGYPDACDTDAKRASCCVQELSNLLIKHKMICSLQHGIEFSFRIGINTGMVTVLENADHKAHLSGLMLNYTGKLCAAADPDMIYLSKNSYLLLKDSFECREIDRKKLPECFPDIPVYMMSREYCLKNKFQENSVYISPMVGRDGELARLHDIWKTTFISGKGKVVLLRGDAGIGKSRLAAEFVKNIAHDNCTWIECRCLPEMKNKSLHSILDFIRNIFDVSENDLQKSNCLILEQKISSFGIDCNNAMPLFCSWLGVSAGNFTIPQISQQKQKECLLQMLSEIIVKIAKRSNSVIIIEDLHWADSTTLELLPELFKQVKISGLMLLLSSRSHFVPSWNSMEAEVLLVNTLEDQDIEVIVKSTLGCDTNSDTLGKIIARVDGVPLFAEEIARLIRENGVYKKEIPITLRDLLNGKIDLLGPARETARIASVIGRKFNYDLIEKVSFKDPSSLLADLDQLISAGLIHVQLQLGQSQYIFNYELIREAAFESIGKKIREKMHLRIAQVLELTADVKPELLAWHRAQAGECAKETKSGVKAAAQYLNICKYNFD